MNKTFDPHGILGVVTIIAGIKFSASIVGPVLGALFFAILFGMFMRWLEKKRTSLAGSDHCDRFVNFRHRRVLPFDRDFIFPTGCTAVKIKVHL